MNKRAGAWPHRGGAMGQLIGDLDWSRTPLGALADWPQSLKSAVDVALQCHFPMIVLWGADLIQVYNDAYAEIMAAKHPAGLGRSNQSCWPEVWDFNRPIYQRVLEGETVTLRDQHYPLIRRGYPEDVYLTLCYSPIHDEAGEIGGVYVTIFETTAEIEAREQQERAREELHASEARYRALAKATTHSQFRISADGTRLLEVLGGEAVADGQADQPWFQSFVPPGDLKALNKAWLEAVTSRSSFRMEHRGRTSDGAWGWVVLRAVPVFDQAGAVSEWIGSITDVTARRWAEEETRDAKEFAEQVVAAVREPLVVLDDEFCLVLANPSFFGMFKLDPESARGHSIFDLGGGQWDSSELRGHLEVALEQETPFHDFEILHAFADEPKRTLLVNASRMGQLRQVLLSIEDVTERKVVEERQRLLMRELDHRAKNMLSVVQSIVQLTKAESPSDFAEAVIGRIGALARAHSLLSKTRWTGVSVRELLQLELGPYRGATIEITGEEIWLRPEAAQPLALALHELATNAAKYGALSANGRLQISWNADLERSRLHLEWRESGGPPVHSPTRVGFGSSLIQAAIERQLGGARRKHWNRDGLVCEIEMPLDQVDFVPTDEPAGEGEMPSEAIRILLVEDDALIALDMENTLKDLSYAVSGPFGNIAETLRAIDVENRVSAAVIDANLEGESAAPIAKRLQERGIPFVVVTGYADVPEFGEEGDDLVVLSKPVAIEELRRVLARMTSPSMETAPAGDTL